MKGFKQFIENQGIVALAIGFILGGAISKFVTSLVTDIINPVLNGILGGVEDLDSKVFHVTKTVSIHYGSFVNNGIDFLVIAIVVYFGVRLLRIDQEKLGKIDIGKIGSFGSLPNKK
jgi:large conductance mechanosensitive channel